jgi:tetratricopeptide (TPR) repeat protein
MSRAKLTCAAGLLVLLAAPGQAQEWSSNRTLVVEVDPSGARDRASVRAVNASLERVVDELARRTGRIVRGLDGPKRAALVTVELVDRPIEQILEYVLGTCGLRAEFQPGAIEIVEENTEALSVERVRELAMSQYVRATMRFPGHPAVERGRLSQGALEEARGNLAAALEQYQILLDDYPNSPLRLEGHLRAGDALERLGRFAEAAGEYRHAAGTDEQDAQHVPARLGLARCQLALGNPELAEILVDTLDDAIPSDDRADTAERNLVRARTQVAREQFVDALATLDQLDRLGLPDSALAESMELRARAFEGLELMREAGRFWLVRARLTEGPQAAAAFERAATLADEDSDPLGVLFVVAEAQSAGAQAELGALERAARLQLGLPIDLNTEDTDDEERLRTCELWLEEARCSEARPVLLDLHQRRGELPALLRTRAALAWARCLHEQDGLEPALVALRQARASIEELEDRRTIDLFAAELLERSGQFTRAMAAYEGRY